MTFLCASRLELGPGNDWGVVMPDPVYDWRTALAWHESGHALYAIHFARLPTSWLTIVQHGELAGQLMAPIGARSAAVRCAPTVGAITKEIALKCSGPIAQMMYDPTLPWALAHGDTDRSHAFGHACRLGLNSQDAALYVERVAGCVRRLFDRPVVRTALAALAAELLSRGTMHPREVREVLEGAGLRRP